VHNPLEFLSFSGGEQRLLTANTVQFQRISLTRCALHLLTENASTELSWFCVEQIGKHDRWDWRHTNLASHNNSAVHGTVRPPPHTCCGVNPNPAAHSWLPFAL